MAPEQSVRIVPRNKRRRCLVIGREQTTDLSEAVMSVREKGSKQVQPVPMENQTSMRVPRRRDDKESMASVKLALLFLLGLDI